MTREALLAYSVGLLGLIFVKVLAPGFYARQNIKTPVKVALLTLAATQLMNLAFIGPLKHAGLALSIGLAACLNAAILYRLLRKHGIFQPEAGWGGFLARVLAAVALMALALHYATGPDGFWLTAGALPKAAALLGLVALGIAVYFAALLLLGVHPRQFYHGAAK